jgi:hypothetical protein
MSICFITAKLVFSDFVEMVVMRTKYHYFVIEIILYMNQLKTLLVIGFVWPEPNSSAVEVE